MWPAWLSVDSTADGVFRFIAIMFVAFLIISYSSLFEQEYSEKLTGLYIYPWWRILLVLLVLSSAMWCPRVGLLVAFAVFFYLSDMNTLITPIANL
jgi:hypothetical protein